MLDCAVVVVGAVGGVVAPGVGAIGAPVVDGGVDGDAGPGVAWAIAPMH